MIINKDLRPYFLVARDQGSRPTCLAFALSDAHSAERPPHDFLSTEFLFYHSVQRTALRNPANGVPLDAATEALRMTGQPSESQWPYDSSLAPSEQNWLPPVTTSVFTADSQQHQASLVDTYGLLDQNKPAVLIIQPSKAFYSVDESGMIPHLADDPQIPALHAVVAIGYGSRQNIRHLLLRNSWGKDWGDQGHAWAREDYLASRLKSVTSLFLTS